MQQKAVRWMQKQNEHICMPAHTSKKWGQQTAMLLQAILDKTVCIKKSQSDTGVLRAKPITTEVKTSLPFSMALNHAHRQREAAAVMLSSMLADLLHSNSLRRRRSLHSCILTQQRCTISALNYYNNLCPFNTLYLESVLVNKVSYNEREMAHYIWLGNVYKWWLENCCGW